jgi:uncharacterized BrkB/YihY/UPF0761 family membrane protein
MQRIGIASSHIAKGNLFLYNFFVVLISFLFSLLVLVVAGLVIVLGLVTVAYLTQTRSIMDLSQGALSPIPVCLIFLGMVTSVFCCYAIVINVQIKRHERP